MLCKVINKLTNSVGIAVANDIVRGAMHDFELTYQPKLERAAITAIRQLVEKNHSLVLGKQLPPIRSSFSVACALE